MNSKSPDAFRTISEVADWLGVPTHVLRFWESRFSQVKPVKRAGGRRYYRPADMELLGGICHLLHEDGLTIRGVQKMLREHGVKHVSEMSRDLDDMAQKSPDATNVINLEATSPAKETADTIDADDTPPPPQPAALPVSDARPQDAKDDQPEAGNTKEPASENPIETVAEAQPDLAPENIEVTPKTTTTDTDVPDPNQIPAPEMGDISDIPADPDDDSIELPDLKGSLLANLRAAGKSSPAPLGSHAELSAIAQRLTALKTRMKHEKTPAQEL